MKHPLTLCILSVLIALPLVAQAQELHQWRMPEQAEARGTAPDGLHKLHITDKIANSPEGRQALEDFHRRKALGLLPRAAKHVQALGDTMTFKALNNTTSQLDDIDFKLMSIDPSDPPRFQIWAELAELDNEHITEVELDAIERALGVSTPDASYDPGAGVIDIDEVVFGEPPDVDGDGITDVLLLDIRDAFDGEDNLGWLAGFVSGSDLSSIGNNRDVLYLDTEPTLRLRGIVEMEQTAAHEYQHLIHFNYDRNELSFINEGLSEWAEVLCGYLSRSVTYLDDVDTYNVPFLRFSSTFASVDDRQRGAMFINYIADRFGTETPGVITRQSANGSDGLRDALIGIHAEVSLEQLLADFHVANYLNDTNLDPIYGYTTPQRLGLRAEPGAFYDGRTASATPTTSAAVFPGAVQYVVWDEVTDFSLTLNALDGVENLRGMALLFQGGSFETSDLNFIGAPAFFAGTYDRIAVLVIHEDPDAINPDLEDSDAVDFDYSAAWNVEQTISLVPVRYDNDQAVSGSFFLISQTPNLNLGLATRFVVPSPERGTTLDKVSLAPYFSNQFSNPIGSETDPRDLTLYIWGPGPGGEPGDVLFSQVFDDPRPFRAATSLTLDFFDLDLAPFADQLSPLPDTIFVGYGEAGEETEGTVLVVGVSPYAEENVSFIGNASTSNWQPLWDVQFSGGDPDVFPVRETVIPMRAQFAVVTATATEDLDELPDAITLHPNFPNPFNPTTSIRYALPQTAEVRLAVYDLLGREVAVLVEGLKPPGEHLVEVDAARWASGLYFYTIEAAGQTKTQRMVLIK